MYRFLMIILFLTACSSHSMEDFLEEGESVVRTLVREMRVIKTKEELYQASGRIQYLFDELVQIMISAEKYALVHPELEKSVLDRRQHELCDQLRMELNRLCFIEGGPQMIENWQKNALLIGLKH